jgi:hypothetical protein
LAGWLVADFEFFLSTGLTPDGAPVTGNMSEVIRNTSKLSPEDRHAMASYLVTLSPRPAAKPRPELVWPRQGINPASIRLFATLQI